MRKYLYISIFGILGIFLVYKYFNEKSSIQQSEIIKCEIQYVRCQIGTQGSRSLLKVLFKNKTYPVQITKSKCKELTLGDSIRLLYSKENDKIIYDKKVLNEKLKQKRQIKIQ